MIPKIVHHIWTSGDKFKPQFYEWRESWMHHNPDFTFMFWELSNLEYEHYTPLGRKLLKSDLFYEGKMDIATWEILFLYGGFKADIDTRCCKSFEPLLKYNSVVCRSYRQYTVGVPIVGMSKENPISREAGNAVNEMVLTKWKKKFDPNFTKYLDKPAVPALLKSECILPREAFYPIHWETRKEEMQKEFPNSYAVHYWSSADEADLINPNRKARTWATIILNAERRAICARRTERVI